MVHEESAVTPANSAFDQVTLIGHEIESVERYLRHLTELLSDLTREQLAWQAGGQAESRIVRVLTGMDDTGWHVLPDRHWPGTRRSNIDVILVGPGGVFVIDVKNWSREVRVEAGRLWRGDADADDALDKLMAQTAAIESILAETGLPPTEVVPLLVLAGRRSVNAELDRVKLLGEHDLVTDLIRRGVRLTPESAQQVMVALNRECPPMRPHRPPEKVSGSRSEALDLVTAPLMSTRSLWEAIEEAAALEPIEAWMTWLHPLQARQVNRAFSGPARIRGGAGTGKTVLALHRAKHLAARGDRVLFASFLKTLAPINKALFARLAPAQRDKVEFTTVHALAARWTREHGSNLRFDFSIAHTCFSRAWSSVRHDATLSQLNPNPKYWQEEIQSIIKGRGLKGFESYAQLSRVGRRTPLNSAQRAAVWTLCPIGTLSCRP